MKDLVKIFQLEDEEKELHRKIGKFHKHHAVPYRKWVIQWDLQNASVSIVLMRTSAGTMLFESARL